MDYEADKYNLLEQMMLGANEEPPDLPLSLLKSITNDFAEDRKIGSGGFADVYEGRLHNGSVAVKRMFQRINVDESYFSREVTNLINVKHQNIVRFLGYCADTQGKVEKFGPKIVVADIQQRLLCFEFLPNGSLDKRMNNVSSGGLEWSTWYQIIKGLCRGLRYLHQHNIVHRDLKPANILLDYNMVPKICDFGLSRCFEEKQTREVTKTLVGTLGYMAPELINCGVITIKSDIYSLGIIIMEIMTGQKGYLQTESVLKSWSTRFQISRGGIWLEHVKVCAEIALECIDSDPLKRPITHQILERLDKVECTCGPIETNHSAIPTLSATRTSRLPVARHKEILLRCIKENLGYKDGKPVAACIIYKCLLHWRTFESERTAIFDHLIEAIHDVLKGKEADGRLPYYLSNISALLCLLQRNLRLQRNLLSNGLFATPSRRSGGGKIAQTLRSPLEFAGRKYTPQVDARYPAILFKQKLTACVEKIFGQLRDNLKKEISSLLSVCIRVPESTVRQPRKTSKSPGVGAHPASNSNWWDSIINFLDLWMDTLRENYVPSFFIRKLITQLFSFINIQLFNSLLLRRECCTMSNGEYVKAGLLLLEQWITDETEEFSGTSWHELNYIRQTVGFLVIHDKSKKTFEEITQDFCPSLSTHQIYRICSLYWDDKYGSHGVSNEVVAAMREIVNICQDLVPNSFLLDDDLSIPFSTEDLSMAIPAIDYDDIDLPESLQHYTSV